MLICPDCRTPTEEALGLALGEEWCPACDSIVWTESKDGLNIQNRIDYLRKHLTSQELQSL